VVEHLVPDPDAVEEIVEVVHVAVDGEERQLAVDDIDQRRHDDQRHRVLSTHDDVTAVG